MAENENEIQIFKSSQQKKQKHESRNQESIRNTASGGGGRGDTAFMSPGRIINICIIRKKTNKQTKPETTALRMWGHMTFYPGISSPRVKICRNK